MLCSLASYFKAMQAGIRRRLFHMLAQGMDANQYIWVPTFFDSSTFWTHASLLGLIAQKIQSIKCARGACVISVFPTCILLFTTGRLIMHGYCRF